MKIINSLLDFSTKNSISSVLCLALLLLAGCSDNGDDLQNPNVAPIVNTDPNCSQIVNIPDANFKAKLVEGGFGVCLTLDGQLIIDKNGDGEIQVCEAENVAILTIDQSDINSIEGILQFRNIERISFKYNNLSQPLDLTTLRRLASVSLTNNNIPSLNISGLNYLKDLQCSGNNLQTLSVKSLGSLNTLQCETNQITNLNIEGAVQLVNLRISHNNISQLNVSHLSNLQHLSASDNSLTNLNLSGLAKLQHVNCASNNLQTLDATGCVELYDLNCAQNSLHELKLSGCTNLITLDCMLNKLPSLNFTGLQNLNYISCSGNRFITIDIRDCANVSLLDVSFNPNLQSLIVKNGSTASQGINIYQCPSLTSICCDSSEQAEILSDVQLYGYNCNVVTNCF